MRTVPTALFLALALALGLAGCQRDPAPAEPVAADDPAPAATTATPPPPTVVTDTSAADMAAMEAAADAETAAEIAAAGTFLAAEATVTLVPATLPGPNGVLTLTVDNGGVRMTGTVSGMEPGTQHGFHVHETGKCDPPDFSTAGAHFNPTGEQHGDREADEPHHAGDMANLIADKDGNATVDQVLSGLQLGSGGALDVVGKAVIVHLQQDDYLTQPSGDSGIRLSCGVITLSQAPPPAGVGPADELPDGQPDTAAAPGDAR